MIIWEEYRLHAIVFTVRCVSVYLYEVFMPAQYRGSTLHRLLFIPVVLGHHLVVDEITRRHGSKEGRTTVRSGTSIKDTAAWKITILRAYSFYQFLALGSHLLPQQIGVARGDAGFNTLIAIQSSAFLMTLFRKGLIRDHSHALWYSLCLIFSSFHILRMFPSYMFVGKIVAAFLLRTQLRINKYFLWIGFVLVSLPAIDDALQSALGYIWDAVSRGDAHTLYGETAAALSLYQWKNVNVDGITASGFQYWQDLRSNVALGYSHSVSKVQDIDSKYKLTAAMLAVVAIQMLWVRGGAAGVHDVLGGLLRPLVPAAAVAPQADGQGSAAHLRSASHSGSSAPATNQKKMNGVVN